MIKRSTPILFLILAYAILLAHTFVPHYHHSNQVCIVASHCSHESEEHNHSEHDACDAHNHEQNQNHDGDGDGRCLLKQQYTLTFNSTQKHAFESPAFDLDNALFDRSVDLADFNSEHHFLSILSKGPLIYQPFFYNYIACSAVGLRAPPVA